jgi:uncharacterized membrane protein YuzA (DUF378 family)
MAKKSVLDWIVVALVIIGAVNWGLVGLGGFLGMNLNVVNLVLGSIAWLENIVYVIVGLAGLYKLYMVVKK